MHFRVFFVDCLSGDNERPMRWIAIKPDCRFILGPIGHCEQRITARLQVCDNRKELLRTAICQQIG